MVTNFLKILGPKLGLNDPCHFPYFLLLKEQFDQGLHCLPFRLYLLDAFLYSKATLFKF